jgi:AcrR family transcriptional regulator
MTRRSVTRPRLTPRKTPVQERSRATVDAVLQAAADILTREGYAKLTTNAIAERAGVNIASVYQYFPNKDAIAAELRRRHVAEQHEAARQTLTELQGKGLKQTIRVLVSTGLAAHAAAPRLHHALTEELPARRSRIGSDDPVFAEARQHLRRLMKGVPDRELALWMVDTVAYAAVHRAAVERPEDLSSPRFAEELVTLLLRYLQRPERT